MTVLQLFAAVFLGCLLVVVLDVVARRVLRTRNEGGDTPALDRIGTLTVLPIAVAVGLWLAVTVGSLVVGLLAAAAIAATGLVVRQYWFRRQQSPR